jgi:hypothetical protein
MYIKYIKSLFSICLDLVLDIHHNFYLQNVVGNISRKKNVNIYKTIKNKNYEKLKKN